MTASLSIGDKAPAFDLPISEDKTISITSCAPKNIVLYFYPKDDTPGCTTEAKDFRDYRAEFDKAGTIIVGVSKDTVKSHDTFKQKYCLPFDLASDETGETCEAYNVWVEKSMYGKSYMGIERSTFLIDGNGIIKGVWRKVKVDNHVSEVLKAAQAL